MLRISLTNCPLDIPIGRRSADGSVRASGESINREDQDVQKRPGRNFYDTARTVFPALSHLVARTCIVIDASIGLPS